MSGLREHYEDYRTLALDLLGKVMAKERKGKLLVMGAKLTEIGRTNATYSIDYDVYTIASDSSSDKFPNIEDSTSMAALTGGERLNLEDVNFRLEYETSRLFNSLKSEELDGRVRVILGSGDNRMFFTFRRPPQQKLI